MDLKKSFSDLIIEILEGMKENKFENHPQIELKHLLISLQCIISYNDEEVDVFLDDEKEEEKQFIQQYYNKRKTKAKHIVNKLIKCAMNGEDNIQDEYQFLTECFN